MGWSLGNELQWIPLMGSFEVADRRILFHGGELSLTGESADRGLDVGNLVCNRHFRSGSLEATITFSDTSEGTACGLMLSYDPSTRSFVQAQLGGLFLASLVTFDGQWRPHAIAGVTKVEPGRPYRFRASVVGSSVTISINGVEVLATNLPSPLLRGQAGIWCRSKADIAIEDFTIETERSKAFVVMQFTAPYNELYAEVIRPVCESHGFLTHRADETYGPGIIIADIERQIIEAQVVIADITPHNANVYYEVGFAHALRKPTILIAESTAQLPFDVSPFRTLFYENSIAGKSRVEAGLRKHLGAIARVAGIVPPETGQSA